MQVPPFTIQVLADYDAPLRPVAERQIVSALFASLQKHKPLPPEEEDGFRAEVWAFDIPRSELGKSSAWGTYFGPRKKDGAEDNADDRFEMKTRGPALIEYWSKRADESKHPVLRAMYADLVWDLSRFASGGRPRVRFAHLAIDSYLEAVASQLYHESIDAIQCAARALSLSLSIRDEHLTAVTTDGMFRLFDLVAVPNLPGTWVLIFDSLFLNRKVKLTAEQSAKLLASMEDILAKCVAAGEQVNLFAAQLAADRLGNYYRRTGRRADAERILRAYGSAVEGLVQTRPAAEVLLWLQLLVKSYDDRGMRSDAERANRLLSDVAKRAQGEMKKVSVTSQLPAEKIDAYLDALTSGGLPEAIRRIAIQFIPRVGEARRFLWEAEKNFPFSSMFGTLIVGDAGIVSEAGSVSDDQEGRLVVQLTQLIDLSTHFLAWAIDKARDLYSPSADDIVGFLYQSPAFDPDRRSLVREGVEGYLSGDLVKAVHVLLPQIEYTLLRLAEHLGVARKPSRRSRNAVEWANLYDFLQEKAMRECLGTDLTLYVQVLLVDQRGHNIRNHVSHGHLKPEYFIRQLADRVFHVLLALSLIRERADGETA